MTALSDWAAKMWEGEEARQFGGVRDFLRVDLREGVGWSWYVKMEASLGKAVVGFG